VAQPLTRVLATTGATLSRHASGVRNTHEDNFETPSSRYRTPNYLSPSATYSSDNTLIAL
jgi:hypothetical protein